MVPRQLYKHGDKWYVILKYIAEHNVRDKDGVVRLDVLSEWRDHVGADHVLRDASGFMLCETVEEATIVPY